MRRGHPGIGGWRNDNHRHFRPRTGGTPRFRPPRLFSLLDAPRFPPPGPRLHRGSHPYNAQSDEHVISNHHEINNYRNIGHHQNNPRSQDRHQPRRNVYQYVNPNLKQDGNTQSNTYNHPSNFYNDQGESFHVNSLGDVDHRQLANTSHGQESYNTHRINPWADPPPNQRQQHYEDRGHQAYRHHDSERHHGEINKNPSLDYTGHRPPSSDYYGSTSTTTINNNNTAFSRSVDDTVDIVRRRLMNRNEPPTDVPETSEPQTNSEQHVQKSISQHNVQEMPTKKRIPRQKQNIKSNCDKMKSNIVNELFKMDKDKMHKLMDDPGSSSKFEYAISSFITESQNSLNRHLRSVAEKSLVSTSSDDFIHNDNNTIYEDTFMKQMQCILDPQDSILLEDIKPLVMAELSKVLQIDDFEARCDTDEQNAQQLREFQQSYTHYENFHYNDFPPEVYDYDQRNMSNDGPEADMNPIDNTTVENLKYEHQEITNEEDFHNESVLFERRSLKKSDQDHRRQSVENTRQRMSTDNQVVDTFPASETTLPLFDTNTEQFSEEEDTFAELDRQYHVAVDPNFLENLSARTTPNYVLQVDPSLNIKQEFNHQLQSSENLLPGYSDNNHRENSMAKVKEEIIQSPDFPKENSTPVNTDNISSRIDHISKQGHAARSNATVRESEKPKRSSVSKTSPSNSRKRSIDQRPPHRKEKRKKSESNSSDITKSDRSGSTSSRDRHSKPSEKCNDLSKPYYSIFHSRHGTRKEISSKDHKRSDSSQKGYSDKYVKRKESRDREPKSRDREPHKKRCSSSSSQTILSPKDSSSNNTSVTPTKNDSKTKLKPIDMFVEQAKKVSVHQAHRNTAPTPAVIPKAAEEKPTPVVTSPQKAVQTKHAATQVFKRVINKETQTVEAKNVKSRFCQTDKQNQVSVAVQTPRVFSNKPKPEAKDAFERMKEIDMEIQELLQEKFQLYNNLESKHSAPQAQAEQSYLSVTVVNVAAINQQEENSQPIKVITNAAPVDNTIPEIVEVEPDIIKMEPEIDPDVPDTITNADAIVDDFTNIPVEELEQIALESVENVNFEDVKIEKRSSRHRALRRERMNSESPKSTSSRRSNKKAKTPNISLIEQIITDDRPLEDIISLDDLEETPRKHKKKPHRSKPKKKSSKKSKPKTTIDISSYGLKECSVVLIQADVNKYLKQSQQHEELRVQIDDTMELDKDSPVSIKDSPKSLKECPISFKESPERKSSEPEDVIEESVVNDLQFDMLDVSEDIVIGESCEIKDKDSSEQTVTVSEDLILDNSQSSADDALVGETGHVENECRTYDYSTDEELRRDSLIVTGNVDAVLAIECIESDFVAACLDGNVYHFSGDGQLLNTMRGSNLAVTCLTIVKEKYETIVYTGSLDSRIRYYDLDTGLEKGPECNVLSPIQTMDRAWDTVFVGTRTGFVLQFECKNNMLIPISTVKFSEQAILALRAMKEGPRKVLLVASRSENVTIKDAQTGLLLRTLAGPKMTVYSLLFEDGKVYCGTSSNQIHVFDYASGAHSGCHSGGKGAVCLRATGGLLFAGCYDGCVYVYREGDTRPLAQLRGPGLMLLSLAVVGSKIIAGYKDRSLYIWKIPLSILQEMIL